MSEEHLPTRLLDQKSTNVTDIKSIEPPDNHHSPLPESNFKKFLRALFFFPISIGEFALRMVLLILKGEPKNPAALLLIDFLSLIFWPQRLINQLPPSSRYRVVVRIANVLILTTLIMFAFPPLAGALVGAVTLSAALAYLPAGFSALLAFCIAGIMYTIVFQYFNRSDVVPSDDEHSLHNHPAFKRLRPKISKYAQLSLGVFVLLIIPIFGWAAIPYFIRWMGPKELLDKHGVGYLYEDGWLTYTHGLALSDHQIKNLGFILRFCDVRTYTGGVLPQPFDPGAYYEILPQILNISEGLKDHQMKNLKNIFPVINAETYKKIFIRVINVNKELNSLDIERIKTVLKIHPNLICPNIFSITAGIFSITEILALTDVQVHNLSIAVYVAANGGGLDYGDRFEKILHLPDKIIAYQPIEILKEHIARNEEARLARLGMYAFLTPLRDLREENKKREHHRHQNQVKKVTKKQKKYNQW